MAPKKTPAKASARFVQASQHSKHPKVFMMKTSAEPLTPKSCPPPQPPSPLPPVLSLPNELLIKVFKDLAPENLIALAFTCKYAGYVVTATYPTIPRTGVVTRKLCGLLSPSLLPPHRHMCGECGLLKEVDPSVKATWYMSDGTRKGTVLKGDKNGLVNGGWHVLVPSKATVARSSASTSNPITNAACPDCARMVYNRSVDAKRAKGTRFENALEWRKFKQQTPKQLAKHAEMQYKFWLVRKEISFRSRFASVHRTK